MKNLALFLVPLLAILQEGASYEGSVTCWAGGQYSGTHYEFQTSYPHLGSIGFDNTIESIRVTGVWLFYDHEVYNTNHPDPTDMFWSYGINYALNIPSEYQNTATSLRPAGCVGINDDCWNVYEGLYFAARTFAGSAEMSDLSFLDFDVSSIILTGKSAWTFCEGLYFSGACVCLYPNTDHVGKDLFSSLDVGIFPIIGDHGMLHVASIRKGCFGKHISPSTTTTPRHNHHLSGTQPHKNGAGHYTSNVTTNQLNCR
ncbi:hypothetical protein Pmani_020005 [Petrolisthes manimaculis]|uniref:Beta/gamma crystallin 'Greek key' domain-containing protein n=1 Tax=Petrolisthes manimaculis TaxID=1843537 RepID=A0AAE1PJL9_9EUCA|nr:hypothetical protein Pmani_020005 [Petrolisthes manimaculis]